MSSIIQLLPDHVANQIAAGEVVQRPASVVKELLENAVDAKATDIKLIIKDAGKTLIQVIDNGIGMSVIDARLCFERHATSKIRQAEDLFAINSKGFRGEALASIAAIAHVELKTKLEQEELGNHIVIEGSKIISQEMAVLPKGTSFLVKNLFFNIPARRNFLKSDTIEYRHIIDEFQRVALAHPNIYFTFYHNGNEIFNLSQVSLKQRIIGIFAGKMNEKLIPIHEETDILVLDGFVGKPEFSKKNRNEQFLFVNNRFIKSSYLHHAIMNAFDGLLKDGAQPSYFIYLQVPPHTIDINIHPTKTEIKFDEEQSLYAILRAAVKHSLGQFNIGPILDFERDANLDTPYSYHNTSGNFPTIAIDNNYNPFVEEKITTNQHYKKATNNWDSLYVGLKPDFETNKSFEFEKETTIYSLFNDEKAKETKSKSYQIDKKYIVTSIKSGLVIIDQNRAHQRILYEQFLTNMTINQAARQQLLFPIELFFNPIEIDLLKELKPALHNTGFEFDIINEDKINLSGIPATVAETEVEILLENLLLELQDGVPESSFSQNDTMAKSMAKSLAIKNGRYLNEFEQENLVNQLFACKEPNFSPFQKTTFITLTVDELDTKF